MLLLVLVMFLGVVTVPVSVNAKAKKYTYTFTINKKVKDRRYVYIAFQPKIEEIRKCKNCQIYFYRKNKWVAQKTVSSVDQDGDRIYTMKLYDNGRFNYYYNQILNGKGTFKYKVVFTGVKAHNVLAFLAMDDSGKVIENWGLTFNKKGHKTFTMKR